MTEKQVVFKRDPDVERAALVLYPPEIIKSKPIKQLKLDLAAHHKEQEKQKQKEEEHTRAQEAERKKREMEEQEKEMENGSEREMDHTARQTSEVESDWPRSKEETKESKRSKHGTRYEEGYDNETQLPSNHATASDVLQKKKNQEPNHHGESHDTPLDLLKATPKLSLSTEPRKEKEMKAKPKRTSKGRETPGKPTHRPVGHGEKNNSQPTSNPPSSLMQIVDDLLPFFADKSVDISQVLSHLQYFYRLTFTTLEHKDRAQSTKGITKAGATETTETTRRSSERLFSDEECALLNRNLFDSLRTKLHRFYSKRNDFLNKVHEKGLLDLQARTYFEEQQDWLFNQINAVDQMCFDFEL